MFIQGQDQQGAAAEAGQSQDQPGQNIQGSPNGDATGKDGQGSTSEGQSRSSLTPEQQAAAAELAKVPDTADGYNFKLSDETAKLVGDLSDDPLMKSIRDHAKAQGWSQGQFNAVSEILELAAKSGAMTAAIDPAAELKALGENGAARQKEMETYLQALKARNEIDEAMFEEGAFLMQTAAGIKLLEHLKGQAKAVGDMDPPPDGGGDPKAAAQAKAREMAADERYKTDPAFKREADKLYMEAFS